MVVVIDTNILISAALFKGSIPDQAVRKAFTHDIVIRSVQTTEELSRTLKAQKFDRYFKNEYERNLLIHLFATNSKLVEVKHKIDACRDSSDNKYLELALSGGANCIITGDADLLLLSPFNNIPIIKAANFLSQ